MPSETCTWNSVQVVKTHKMAENRYFVCFSCQTTISNVIIGRDLICFGIFHLSVEPNIAPTQFLKPLSKQFFICCSSFRDFYYKFFQKTIVLIPRLKTKSNPNYKKKENVSIYLWFYHPWLWNHTVQQSSVR